MVYPSKKDAWLVGIIVLTAGAMVVSAVYSFLTDSMHPAFAAVMIAAAGLVMWVLYAVEYEIGSTELIVRCSPFSWRIPLCSIESAAPTHNPLSAPALSLDRLRVNYRVGEKQRFILISPRDRLQFLSDLASATPELVVVNGRLERVSGGGVAS